jgi:hypothetical protein
VEGALGGAHSGLPVARSVVRRAIGSVEKWHASTPPRVMRSPVSTRTTGLADDALADRSGAQCLALDPADSRGRLRRPARGWVRRTTDGGASWIDCGLPAPGVFSLAVSRGRRARLRRAPSRARSTGATTAGRPGWSSPACSSCRRARRGASRRGPGRRTCAGSRRARTTPTCSWSGSSWAD